MSFSLYIHTQSLNFFFFLHTPGGFWTHNLPSTLPYVGEEVGFELELIGQSFFFLDLHLNLTAKHILSSGALHFWTL